MTSESLDSLGFEVEPEKGRKRWLDTLSEEDRDRLLHNVAKLGHPGLLFHIMDLEIQQDENISGPGERGS